MQYATQYFFKWKIRGMELIITERESKCFLREAVGGVIRKVMTARADEYLDRNVALMHELLEDLDVWTQGIIFCGKSRETFSMTYFSRTLSDSFGHPDPAQSRDCLDTGYIQG